MALVGPLGVGITLSRLVLSTTGGGSCVWHVSCVLRVRAWPLFCDMEVTPSALCPFHFKKIFFPGSLSLSWNCKGSGNAKTWVPHSVRNGRILDFESEDACHFLVYWRLSPCRHLLAPALVLKVAPPPRGGRVLIGLSSIPWRPFVALALSK